MRRRRWQYEDFTVQISADGQGGFRARVLRSPGGSGASAPFKPPEHTDGLDPLLDGVARAVLKSSSDPGRHVVCLPSAPRSVEPGEIGKKLFRALFRGPIRRVLDTSLERVRQRDRQGLRLQLAIDPRERGCACVAALPWELLFDESGAGFLGRRRSTSIVRFLEVTMPPLPPIAKGPLRVLVTLASPRVLPALDFEPERRAVEEWGRLPGVEVDVLAPASFDAVHQRLLERDFHVLHFTGHGDYREGDAGLLLFEGPEGEEDPVSGQFFAEQLDDCPALRLVVLSSCYSGSIPRRDGLDPFAGAAAAIVRRGVPAVVSMQFPISDRAAARFGARFYRTIAAGFDLDAAMVEGRRAIARRESRTLEWATPVLHLRNPGEPVLGRPGRRRPRPREIVAGLVLLVGSVGAGIGWWLRPETELRPATPIRELSTHATAEGCPPPPALPDLKFVRIDPLPPPSATDPGRGEFGPRGAEPLAAIDRPFCIGRHEVTWKEWETVMERDNLDHSNASSHHPVHGVTWFEAQNFIDELNRKTPGGPFRMPNKREWIYAARAGTETRYSFGDEPSELQDFGNCAGGGSLGDDGFDMRTSPVGHFDGNPWGLSDVHGNVWEWVDDVPAEATEGDPKRIKCGGSYENTPDSCISTQCNTVQGDRRDKVNGFRLVREIEPPG